MHITSKPSEFKAILLKTTRVIFQSDELRVEAKKVHNRDSRRNFEIKYYHLVDNVWQDFSTFVSNTVLDCLNDVDYQFKTFKIL
jgi:hypothetical protein